jgi:hypothetical protein
MKLPPLPSSTSRRPASIPRNRITEVGVVTVDGARVEEWSTVINP